jgi:ABC-type sugar transport system ATPase subunit
MPEREALLTLTHVSKAFFGVYAVKDVSFDVAPGEVLSIIGENGAGKSTLMNIIGGVFPPDGGSMNFSGACYQPEKPGDATRSGIAFIHQELNLFNNLSILDNMFINSFEKIKGTPFINRQELRRKTREALLSVDLNVSPDMLVERLSPGERQLVEIAKELSRNPRLIIFDEPTTSLTARETERLFALIEKLKKEGKAVIYISHILGDVMRLSDRILVLRDGRVTDTGNARDFTIDRMILSMVGRDIAQLYPETTPAAKGEVLLDLDGVSQPGIVKNISFQLRSGEIVGVFGLMGSGRSELAHIIYGLERYERGEIRFRGEAFKDQDPVGRIKKGFAFVTENRREEGLLMEFPVGENIQLAALPAYTKALGVVSRAIEQPVKESVEELRIKVGNVKKHQAKGLSGGNQQKVVIAKWLLTKPKMLIIDEPTRGIDVGAKAEIYNLLNRIAASGTGILAISSELEELVGICNRILIMNKGEIVGEFSHEEFDREAILRTAFRQNMGRQGT